jgi:hypothetical protein
MGPKFFPAPRGSFLMACALPWPRGFRSSRSFRKAIRVIDGAAKPRSILPEILEPIGRKRTVAHCRDNRPVAQIVLDRFGCLAHRWLTCSRTSGARRGCLSGMGSEPPLPLVRPSAGNLPRSGVPDARKRTHSGPVAPHAANDAGPGVRVRQSGERWAFHLWSDIVASYSNATL